jgi:hypothetical protein
MVEGNKTKWAKRQRTEGRLDERREMSQRPVRISEPWEKLLRYGRTGAFLLTLTKCLSTNWIQATSASSGISCAYCITRYVTAAFDLLIFAVHCPSFLLRSFYVPLWTTHVTDTDWGVCSWPWLFFFFWEKPYLPLFVTSNWCVQVKNVQSDEQLVHVLSSAEVARRLVLIAKRDKWQFVVKT